MRGLSLSVMLQIVCDYQWNMFTSLTRSRNSSVYCSFSKNMIDLLILTCLRTEWYSEPPTDSLTIKTINLERYLYFSLNILEWMSISQYALEEARFKINLEILSSQPYKGKKLSVFMFSCFWFSDLSHFLFIIL